MGEPSRWQSLKRTFNKFVSQYRETNLGFVALSVASVLFGINGFVSFSRHRLVLGGGAITCISLSLAYNYKIGRPFGIDITCTPTHIVDGERQPDTMSEQRGIAMIQDGELVLHSTVQLSRFTNEFELYLETSAEIEAELRTIPKSEHKYDPEENVLWCEEVNEFDFPLIIEVFPKRGVAEGGRYHKLKIVDQNSGRSLVGFDILNVGH
ncbi:hypothetical protein BDK88_4231 [Natrinema hispanicum]|uniref:Uncharacterized protein n=2 Tax=Natrinema hispanicum TaxID=392421 RepID=A0A482Y7V3_9EURY|nr:hypothetical protein BDK88_4231 [Natrinema hispanicum]